MSKSGRCSMFVLLAVGILLLGSGSDGLADRFGPNGQQTNNQNQWNKGQTTPPAPTPGPKETSKARFNFFDGELLQAVGRDVRGNFVISPASVKTLLGLVLEASTDETLHEIKDLLRLPNNSMEVRELMSSLQHVLQQMNTSQIEVDSETHSFLSKDFTYNTTYEKTIKDVYRAGLTYVNYKDPENAANRINSWVRSQTRGKIDSLIDPATIDPETITILVNTIYFNGKWKSEFLLKDTTEACFYSEPNWACNKVPIMYKKDLLNYKFDKDYNSHVVQLPYKDERFSMVLVVPATVEESRRIARDIGRLTFPALLDRAAARPVHLRLPQFTAEYEADLTYTLTKMGLNTVFSNEAKIPFMLNNKQARVSRIIHKARIEVNEKGTKAAAASGAEVVPLMSGDEEVMVTADHPFYYFIYETESRSVLFSGRVSSLDGEPMNEQNLVGGGATPLSSSSGSGRPSYAQAVNNIPPSPPRQNQRPGPPAPTNSPNSPSFSVVSNEAYNFRPTRPSQPQPSRRPGSDVIEYPIDGGELTGPKYFEDYKNRHQHNLRSQSKLKIDLGD